MATNTFDMIYQVQFSEDFAWCSVDGTVLGKFEIEDFLMHVISPLEFKRFEKNPDKRRFEIRKIEFNLYNILKI